VAVQVVFRLPWRTEELSVALPAPNASVEDILAPLMDERSKGSTFKALNGRICFDGDRIEDGDSLQVLPVILGG